VNLAHAQHQFGFCRHQHTEHRSGFHVRNHLQSAHFRSTYYPRNTNWLSSPIRVNYDCHQDLFYLSTQAFHSIHLLLQFAYPPTNANCSSSCFNLD